MNIGDILSGIKNLGTKAAGTVSSLLSSADKKIIQPAEKTLGDILSGNAVKGPAAATKTVIAINTAAGIPKATVDVAKDIAKGAARFALFFLCFVAMVLLFPGFAITISLVAIAIYPPPGL